MPTPYTDGTFSSLAQVGPARYIFPLQDEGDYTTQQIDQDYMVLAPNVPTPNTIGTATHPLNANAYLMMQSDPSVQYGAAQVTRTFCEVPTETNVYSVASVIRPDLAGVPQNIENTASVEYFYFNAMDSSGTLNEAAPINTLFQFNANYLADGVDPSYYDLFGPEIALTFSSASGNQRTYEMIGHGMSTPQDLIFYSLSTAVTPDDAIWYRIPAAGVTVVNANYVTANIAQGSFLASAPNACSKGWVFQRQYIPGATTEKTRLNYTYYLPGVTPNIATPADITIPNTQTTSTEFITALLDGSTEITYEVTDFSRWNGWPIYRLGVSYVQTEGL